MVCFTSLPLTLSRNALGSPIYSNKVSSVNATFLAWAPIMPSEYLEVGSAPRRRSVYFVQIRSGRPRRLVGLENVAGPALTGRRFARLRIGGKRAVRPGIPRSDHAERGEGKKKQSFHLC